MCHSDRVAVVAGSLLFVMLFVSCSYHTPILLHPPLSLAPRLPPNINIDLRKTSIQRSSLVLARPKTAARPRIALVTAADTSPTPHPETSAHPRAPPTPAQRVRWRCYTPQIIRTAAVLWFAAIETSVPLSRLPRLSHIRARPPTRRRAQRQSHHGAGLAIEACSSAAAGSPPAANLCLQCTVLRAKGSAPLHSPAFAPFSGAASTAVIAPSGGSVLHRGRDPSRALASASLATHAFQNRRGRFHAASSAAPWSIAAARSVLRSCGGSRAPRIVDPH
jgi:hypothetical protein